MAVASPELDLYDVAWLAGGRPRVVRTAVAKLVTDGRMSVADPTGELKVLVRRIDHTVEAAVLDAVGTSGHRGLETLDVLVRNDPRLAAVEDRLVRAGLIASRGLVARAIRWSRPVSRTRAGRRVLRGLRAQAAAAQIFGGSAAGRVALDGLERVPAGLPPALAEIPRRQRIRWSWDRPLPVEARKAESYPGSGGFAAF